MITGKLTISCGWAIASPPALLQSCDRPLDCASTGASVHNVTVREV